MSFHENKTKYGLTGLKINKQKTNKGALCASACLWLLWTGEFEIAFPEVVGK